MNWDDVRIFLAVVRHGTLAQAALRLGIDPTTVSRRLQRLETAISGTVFEHTPAGHVLTARGAALLNQAELMEAAIVEAMERSTGGRGAAEGVIRVSASEGFGTSMIAAHLHEFCTLYPAITVELAASTGFLNLTRREADIAIMLARPKSGPLLVRRLTPYTLGLYAGQDHPAPDSLAALKDARMVGYVPDLIYAPELRYMDELPGTPAAASASTSIHAQAQMIRTGAGIGILPCFLADPDPQLKRVLAHEISISRTFWLVLHKDKRAIARIRLFIDWLTALVARMEPLLVGRK